ncbi:MAG: hypothetical protein IJX89_00630 [Alphaproteobacteria bacterium]|nr:hypothetical protein [Alphaproteobacteria bacterium]
MAYQIQIVYQSMMRADGFREMSWYLFQWTGKIRPIAPKELVSTYNSILKDIILNSQSGK